MATLRRWRAPRANRLMLCGWTSRTRWSWRPYFPSSKYKNVAFPSPDKLIIYRNCLRSHIGRNTRHSGRGESGLVSVKCYFFLFQIKCCFSVRESLFLLRHFVTAKLLKEGSWHIFITPRSSAVIYWLCFKMNMHCRLRKFHIVPGRNEHREIVSEWRGGVQRPQTV